MKPPNEPLDFLFATFEGGGNVSPMVAIAAKLVRRGRSVRLMSDQCNRAEAECVGIEFISWATAPNRS